VEALNDPKVQLLPDGLFKFWVNCLCVARQAAGQLPDVASLAFQNRMDRATAETAVQDLIAGGLLDRTDAGGLTPHNWNTRQYQSDTSTARVKRYRSKASTETLPQRFPKQAPPVTVTDNRTVNLTPISFDEWADWEAFTLWVVGSVDTGRGRMPMIVKDALDKRCPGFLESEAEEIKRCITNGEPYGFHSEWMPGFLVWGLRVVFDNRPMIEESITDETGKVWRLPAYSNDRRSRNLHEYLHHLDKTGFSDRFVTSDEADYPSFEEWRDAAWAHPTNCAECAALAA
jgi:hypothetical protein